MKQPVYALEIALKNELNEHEFYVKHAERTTNPAGKSMFMQIATEEMEHYEVLKQIFELWEKERKWPSSVPLKVRDTGVRDVLKGILKKAEKISTGDRNDLEAIRTAIEFEADGCSNYARLRDECSNPVEKEFFNLMANIEHEHYVSLKETEELLTDPASWYRKMERGGLDGA